MRSILCSITILLSINGLIVHGASCKGGLSVRGYDRLDDLHRYSPSSSSSSNSLFMTASCCDDEQGDIVTCHGGVVLQASDLPATATKAIDNQDDAHHTLTLNDEQRHKRWKPVYAWNNYKRKVVSWRLFFLSLFFFFFFVAIIHKPFFIFSLHFLNVYIYISLKFKIQRSTTSAVWCRLYDASHRDTLLPIKHVDFLSHFCLVSRDWLVLSISFSCSLVIVNLHLLVLGINHQQVNGCMSFKPLHSSYNRQFSLDVWLKIVHCWMLNASKILYQKWCL